MDPIVSLFCWFALIGFLFVPIANLIAFAGIQKGEYPNIRKGSLKARILCLLVIVGAFCCLMMVLQGLHLWGNWEYYAVDMDPSMAAKVAIKGRGKGGIILLVFRYFPQFLVFGYGYWGWEPISKLKYIPRLW